MSELFPIEETLSPRLKWMKDHRVHTHHSPKCDEAPWLAVQLDDSHVGKDIALVMLEHSFYYEFGGLTGYGMTEDEAVAQFAINRKLKLWNE